MTPRARRHLLAPNLMWFTNLRWITGCVLCVGAVIDRFAFAWVYPSRLILAVGLGILLYNLPLWMVLNRGRFHARKRPLDAGSEVRRRSGSNGEKSGSSGYLRTGVGGNEQFARSDPKPHLLRLAVVQMLLDLICVALLVGWTGGLRSPILGFFVFHMVFASLLLPRGLAYGAAVTAFGLLVAALAQTGQLPRDYREVLILLGTAITLVLTVLLTNHITRDLGRQHRRLVRQNTRIKAMSRHLRKHQRAMVRQEKMVALGQMVAGVAHEIANPLASMDSLLQLAQRKGEPMNVEGIGKMREQVSRISAIISQMRSMTHPTGVGETPSPLNEVVTQAIEMVRLDPRARKLGIEQRLDDKLSTAMVRPHALQQVMVNLLLNSLDAVSEVPEPSVGVQTRAGAMGYAIDVIDNGSGIKAEHMNRLFEPFFTTKPVGRGTGLGLSISYGLIERQGGRIDVKSTPGEGTMMTVHLPVIGEEA